MWNILFSDLLPVATTFFGSCGGYLQRMNRTSRETAIRIFIYEMIGREITDGTKFAPNDAQLPCVVERLSDALRTMMEPQMNSFVESYAPRVPTVARNTIVRIFDLLPFIGNILELTPSTKHAFIQALIDGGKLKMNHDAELYVNHDLPNFREWSYDDGPTGRDKRNRRITTIVINMLGANPLSQIFALFVDRLIKRDPAVFAIMIHDANTVFMHDCLVETKIIKAPKDGMVDSGTAITIYSIDEKKITSISGIIEQI